MTNQEQLELLKQGHEVWNTWREHNSAVQINLAGCNLRMADLHKMNLSAADLTGANLSRAELSRTNLQRATLSRADLSFAMLNEAHLGFADLCEADLSMATLRGARLQGARLNAAKLAHTNLNQADLTSAELKGADLSGARLGFTIFESNDLSDTIGLGEVESDFGSVIGANTLQLSRGSIVEPFLRGCGLSDTLIETQKLFNPNLTNDEIIKIQYRIYDLRATQALQISPLFISYSHEDKPFVDQIDAALTSRGVRFWRDIHNLLSGKLETQIDLAIRQNPTVLLVLSKNSIDSEWVQHEVRRARQLEIELRRDTLCPIALDSSWKTSRWPQRIMEQVMEYNILDFSQWENESSFQRIFSKLLQGLDLFYKKPSG